MLDYVDAYLFRCHFRHYWYFLYAIFIYLFSDYFSAIDFIIIYLLPLFTFHFRHFWLIFIIFSLICFLLALIFLFISLIRHAIFSAFDYWLSLYFFFQLSLFDWLPFFAIVYWYAWYFLHLFPPLHPESDSPPPSPPPSPRRPTPLITLPPIAGLQRQPATFPLSPACLLASLSAFAVAILFYFISVTGLDCNFTVTAWLTLPILYRLPIESITISPTGIAVFLSLLLYHFHLFLHLSLMIDYFWFDYYAYFHWGHILFWHIFHELHCHFHFATYAVRRLDYAAFLMPLADVDCFSSADAAAAIFFPFLRHWFFCFVDFISLSSLFFIVTIHIFTLMLCLACFLSLFTPLLHYWYDVILLPLFHYMLWFLLFILLRYYLSIIRHLRFIYYARHCWLRQPILLPLLHWFRCLICLLLRFLPIDWASLRIYAITFSLYFIFCLLLRRHALFWYFADDAIRFDYYWCHLFDALFSFDISLRHWLRPLLLLLLSRQLIYDTFITPFFYFYADAIFFSQQLLMSADFFRCQRRDAAPLFIYWYFLRLLMPYLFH